MAKPKHGAARRGDKQAKPTPKPAKGKPVRKAAAKPAPRVAAKVARKGARKAARKPVVKVARIASAGRVAKPANATKATKATKAAKAAKVVRKVAVAKHGKVKIQPARQTMKKSSRPPVAAHTAAHAAKHPAPRVEATPKPHAHAAVAARPHHADEHAPHQPARKPAHVKPTGGVAARLGKAADPQSITREDGRYALPSTVAIELPKGYRPSVDDEYMNPKHLAYFRQKLKDWRDQLVEESRQTMENLREEVRDVGDDAERATRETENSLELRTRDRYRKLISKIEKALRKIEEGRYGFCEETDEEIGLERLEARPIATLSLDAQERREHLQKQMGD